MSYRTSRLFVLKFFGLWTSGVASPSYDESKKAHDRDILETFDNRKSVEPVSVSPESTTEHAVSRCSQEILKFSLEKGLPGLTVCVSKQNKILWRAGYGYCDVENLLYCHSDARMRIASISKSLFATTVVAPMIEQGKVTLDSSVHKYLSQAEFPKQRYKDKESNITIEQLLSHTSGIRHYSNNRLADFHLKPISSLKGRKAYQSDDQYNRDGYCQRKTYRNVIDALEPFKNSALASEPGKFCYTTYGYTLLSAAMQKILQLDGIDDQIEDFWLKSLRDKWGMKDTFLDQDEVMIPKRSRYYLRTGLNGELLNAPYTDNSVKWAGGGLVSTSEDLVKFANALLDCYKARNNPPLAQKTIELLWKKKTENYALGFEIDSKSVARDEKLIVLHSGAALGGSSIMLIYPESEIVVVVLTNLGFLNLKSLAMFIADTFKKVDLSTS